MQKIGLIAVIWLTATFGCMYQKPIVIEEPTIPRIVVKEVPTGPEEPEKKEKEEYFESSYLYPDLTRGYIENKAFPYMPKVWLLVQGKKILLIGPETGPPKISVGEIREFNLPPGKHIFHIERWQHFAHYGGWSKVRKTEVVKISIAEFRRSGRGRYWIDSHYGWWLIIYPDQTQVYGGYVN